MSLMAVGAIAYPHIDPVLFEIGPLVIRWYSLAYLAGLIFGWAYLRHYAAKPGAPLGPNHIDDFLTWATLGVVVGGRLGYVLFYNLGRYIENPLDIFRLWDGGMSFHGGMLGVVLGTIFFCKRHRLHVLRVGDLIALVAPVGLFFGRLANFINGELWGRPTDVSWAMVFPSDPQQLPRHPSQLYEAMGEGVVLFLILYILWRFTSLPQRMPGILVGLFFMGYGTARFLVEYVREPDAHLGLMAGISRGQMLSLPMVVIGLMFLAYAWRKRFKESEAQFPAGRRRA